MRILILCKKFPYPPKDGEIIAIYNNIKAFHALGHEVTVLAINTLKHYFDPADLPEEVKQMADFRSVTVNTNINPLKAFINLFTGSSYHIDRFISNDYVSELKQLLKKRTFDLVQFEGLYNSPYIYYVREFTAAPKVMRAHNVESEIWERVVEQESNALKKWYLGLQTKRLKKYEQAQLNRYDAIVPITDRDGLKLKEMGARVPMHTLPAGFDMSRFEEVVSSPEPHTICFIGGLDWVPNQEGLKWFLKEVWPGVIAKKEAAVFKIAGRNMPDWLKNWKQEGVEIVGEVADALDFMSSNSIMVVPLLSGSGMRIKIIEGLATGSAIVSTSIGAEGIPAEDGKEILLADNAESYTDKLLMLLNNPERGEQIGIGALDFVKRNYDHQQLVSQLIEFYKTQFDL